MFWIITKDHTFDPSYDCKPRTGLGRLPEEVRALPVAERLAWAEKNLPHRFRTYDDDDGLNYEGRASDDKSEEAFEPLDWAMADVGSTRIDYLEKGKWTTL